MLGVSPALFRKSTMIDPATSSHHASHALSNDLQRFVDPNFRETKQTAYSRTFAELQVRDFLRGTPLLVLFSMFADPSLCIQQPAHEQLNRRLDNARRETLSIYFVHCMQTSIL